jgi:hypothetical protein
LLHALGIAGAPGEVLRPAVPPDYGMLAVPAIDPGSATRRKLNLNIQTALCIPPVALAAGRLASWRR